MGAKAVKPTAKERHVPMRTCIGCREKKAKSRFIRLVNVKGKGVFVDEKNRMRGRGANVCINMDCFENAVRKKTISHALKTEIKPANIEKLRNDFEKVVEARRFRGMKKRVTLRVDKETFEKVVRK